MSADTATDTRVHRWSAYPCGSTGLLLEMGSLQEVLSVHTALRENPPFGVVDMVPAARTLLLHLDPKLTDPATTERVVRAVTPRPHLRRQGQQVVELPVVYDGEDLDEVGVLTGWGRDGVVSRHTSTTWTVAFCGFAPGFGYLVSDDGEWNVPRRDSPRTRVPAGAVGLAGQFSGVYPRASPGGWQLIGRTDATVFDIERTPPALLTPEVQVRFVDAGRR